MQFTADQHLLKDLNRMAIVRHLGAQPGQSRAAVAEALQLTKSTVSTLVKELIAEGWLLEREVVATGELGRRPTPLFIDPGRLVLLGAEMGVDGVNAVVTSLTGDVLARLRSPLDAARDPQLALVRAAKLLVQLHARLDTPQQQVIGIGIGLPGGVDEATGHLHFAPNLGWRDLPVGQLLTEHLRGTPLQTVPMFVQNEADVAALGELEFGSEGRADPLIYLSLGVGVGAGVIVEDRLLTGARGLAGEVGHMTLALDGPRCSCGRRGCAETLIGLRAMLPAADDAGGLAEVRRRLDAEQLDCRAAVANAGRYLGLLLGNLCAAYDPGRIVLGGPSVELGPPFLQHAFATLEELAGAAGESSPTVTLSRFGADAVPVGAAALARYRLTRPLIAARRLAVAA
ncbi:ROK family transcriptional regulator [Roseateles puraquae]|uniref:ROK family transcriptional regulator n=1 Tax=Roseateles puraquae TaxID=431059 RepID=UPI0031D7980B